MQKTELEGCCAIGVVARLACLGETDEYSKRLAQEFDDMEDFHGAMSGDNIRGRIVTLVDGGPDYEGAAFLRRQQAFLVKRGFKLLGKLPVRGYHVLLYGSKEFEVGGRREVKKSAR